MRHAAILSFCGVDQQWYNLLASFGVPIGQEFHSSSTLFTLSSSYEELHTQYEQKKAEAARLAHKQQLIDAEQMQIDKLQRVQNEVSKFLISKLLYAHNVIYLLGRSCFKG